MNELDLYAARTQARITFTLIGGFLGLMFALLLVACLPLSIDDKLLSVLDRIVTAMLPIVGGAVGFWTARHRAQSTAAGAYLDGPMAPAAPLAPPSLAEAPKTLDTSTVTETKP